MVLLEPYSTDLKAGENNISSRKQENEDILYGGETELPWTSNGETKLKYKIQANEHCNNFQGARHVAVDLPNSFNACDFSLVGLFLKDDPHSKIRYHDD